MKKIIKVLISPNAFRDCLSPVATAFAIKKGFD